MNRGWPDLAYHFLVDAEGNVYEGRPVWARGDTGTEYDPTGHFLVCMEGNFDEQSLPESQLRRTADLLAWAAQEFGIDLSTIGGHRDYAQTSCPGDNAYPSVTDGTLEAMTRARLGSGGVVLTPLCGSDGTKAVASIEAGGA